MAKLARLHLENFASLALLDMNFECKDGKIIGQNQVGKTTIINAICYLLTDKLLGGSSDIPSIKPKGIERPKVVVEGTFVTENGEVTLRKEYSEKWVKPRGSESEELQGHSTDYYINGAKQARVKDFDEKMQEKFGIPSELSGLDSYQLAIDPFYFGSAICGSKDWKLARKAIIDIVGDVTPKEIYEFNPKIEIADADLKAHQYDDGETKKAISGEIDGYKSRAIAAEGLIQEYQKTINQDVPGEEYEEAVKQNEAFDLQIASLKSGSSNPYFEEESELLKSLAAFQAEYRKYGNAVIDRSVSEGIAKEIREVRQKITDITLKAKSAEYEVTRLKTEIESKESAQEEYKKELNEIKSELDSLTVSTVCPTCGQQLPEEAVNEAYNKKKAEILAKAQRIRDLAVENKNKIAFLKSTLDSLKAQDYKPEFNELTLKESELSKEYAKAIEDEKSQVKEPDPLLKEKIDKANARLDEIARLKSQSQSDTYSAINELKAKKAELQETFSKRIAAENARKRISEIKAEGIENGKKRAKAEQRLWAVGEFVKTKLSLLDEHMARKFGQVRFQLIKENIKAGSYDEVCVPYIIDPKTQTTMNTLFPDGSKSEQIFTGIQIIKAIRDAKGWNPLPIIYDQGGELDDKSTKAVSYFAEAQIIEVKVEGTGIKPTFVPFEI